MDWSILDWFWPMMVGAIISGLSGWFFAWQSSKELAKTHQQIVLLLRALEAESVIRLSRNEAGDATGIVLETGGTATGTSDASATAVVEQRSGTRSQ